MDGDAGNVLRSPPHSYDAERALLGAAMMNNRALDRVADFLKPEHFADPVNGRIYAEMAAMFAKGQQVNPVTLKPFLERDELVISAGGMKYLGTIAGSAVTIINAKDYGQMIYDLYLRRELIFLGQELVNDAYDAKQDVSAAALAEAHGSRLMSLESSAGTDGGFINFKHNLDAAIGEFEHAYQLQGKTPGVPTGLIDLDKKLGGLWDGNLLILGGRPGMGKTALATTIAFNAAKHFATTDREEHRGKCVAIYSLEMVGSELAGRILCSRAGVSFEACRSGDLSQVDWQKLIEAKAELESLPIFIDETPALTVGAMFGRARRLARKQPIGLTVIDHIGLSEPEDKKANRTQQVGQITRGLKRMAKALHVPVFALAQLSRKVEEREDKRPQMSDLRDSGEIEQDADAVAFIYRSQYYLEKQEPIRTSDETDIDFHNRHLAWQEALNQAHNKAEVIIPKNRHGKSGTVSLHFDAEHMSFTDLFEQAMGGL